MNTIFCLLNLAHNYAFQSNLNSTLQVMSQSIIYRFTLLFFLLSFTAKAQELPPIVKYSSDVYNAGNQSWMITHDKNQFAYFANNEGLLEFNGSSWSLYPSNNETIIRSVKVLGDKVYTGCYMEFGYWQRQKNGTLKYFSLSQRIKNKLIEDEHFWNIIAFDHWVLFQSFNRIYIYNVKDNSFQFSEVKKYIFKSYRVNNSIFYQSIGEGLFEIVNGKSVLVCNDERIKGNRIVEIFKHNNGLLLQTETAGIFKLSGSQLNSFAFESNSDVQSNSVFCALQLSDGGFAIGTISNGLFILDKKGKTRYHITHNSGGLSNNTVLSMSEDANHNLWLGLDNGIDCINLQSPIKSYKDDEGYLGTVYASVVFDNKIYLGTNQGLFYKDAKTNNRYTFISGTKGQVWQLFKHDGKLFCGHNMGTFLVEGVSARLLSKQSGTWMFNVVPGNNSKIIQSNYNGLSILEKVGGEWVFKGKIKNFDISSRYFEISSDNEIYVGHEYKGILRVKVNDDFTVAQKVSIIKTPAKSKHFSLAKFNNSIYFAGKQGIYKLNPKTKAFEKDFNLSKILDNNEYISGKLDVDESNKMWFFTRNYIYYFTVGNFDSELKIHKIPIPFSITNAMLSFENSTQISENEYLIGKTDGYFIINLAYFKVKSQPIIITDISINEFGKSVVRIPINSEGELKSSENNIVFNYTIPQYNRFIDVKYQYLLEGVHENWSEWSPKSSISFKKLEPGDYTFKVRAKIANSISQNIAVYKFTINKPWYSNNLALIIYFLLFIVMAYYINKAYLNYYNKQKEKLIEENNLLLEIAALENEQQLMKLRNEQLSQDVDAKNRELAVSNMSLIKKNELLAIIKDDLKKTSDENGTKNIKSVISTINKNITEDDSWNVFKEAFDSVDKDFLKRIKAKHPNLSPSDLKLCAYLRLNLTSKEIAPMLNISIRSMEIKRHRLRKKLNLMHNDGLVDYILSI